MRKLVINNSSLRNLSSYKESKDSQDQFEELNNLDKNVWGPFKSLPNVSKFKLDISDFDPLFLRYGIKKRLSPKISWLPANNNRVNRYVWIQLHRLTKSSQEDYWKLAKFLIEHSNAFLVMAMNHVYPK